MPESWSARSRRIARERNQRARQVKGRSVWTVQARKSAAHAEEEIARVQGRSSSTSWTGQARLAARARTQRVGSERSWWNRLRGKR